MAQLMVELDEATASALERRAQAQNKPAELYIAELVEQNLRDYEAGLAEEGYALLSQDTAAFANPAWQIAAETWPVWENEQAHGGQ